MTLKEIREDNRYKIEFNKDTILKMYLEENKNIPEIAKFVGVRQEVIWRFLKKQNVNIRKVQWNQYKIDENYFENINSHEKAYWLGWLWSDGFIISRINRVGLRIHPKDVRILENFKKCLKTEIPIGIYYSKRKANKKRRFREGVTSIAQFTFSNAKIVQDLINLGITDKKSLTVDFPLIDKEYFYSFMRGYFEGDGCFYFEDKKDRNYTRFYTIFLASQKFTEKAVEILKNDGFLFSVRKSSSCDKIYHVSMGNKNKVVEFIGKLYEKDDNWLRLDRKYNIYIEMKKNLQENPVNTNRISSKEPTIIY
jgi:intein-encoded DNA endonuclease-like protein